MPHLLAWSQDIASWRREVADLYAAVRAERDPAVAHATWVTRRVELFERHPASARQPGQTLRQAPYDPAYRFLVTPDSGRAPVLEADDRQRRRGAVRAGRPP